ncbi:hypothetical protein NSQ77_15105 [Oceanobacillus sp. FSL K6-2867]|uniref:hypothetical protein n=1 Tax=Oceanobacillus sp. FSL K6-2867 TaxID=2954748 RepID=UPI0030DAD928
MTKPLASKPGFEIFKVADLEKKYPLLDLGKMIDKRGVNSEIVDIPITESLNPLTIGLFSMKPGDSFDFLYETLEFKVVTKGKFVLRDEEGNRHVAETGDIILFSPNVPVVFDGESDGEAIYTKHAPADPGMMN